MQNRKATPQEEQLLERRFVLLKGPIDDDSATWAIAKLLYLQHTSKDLPIRLLVDSEGGSVTGGLAIIDTMNEITPPVRTYCIGSGSGTALCVVARGVHGRRVALPYAHFALAPLVASQGSDVAETDAERMWDDVTMILGQDTHRDHSELRKDMERSLILNAQQAKAYGIVDRVEMPWWFRDVVTGNDQ